MMSISSITPALAVKELACTEPHSDRSLYRCSGGQPMVGDTVTDKTLSGQICTGVVVFVQGFDDTDRDRTGAMNVLWDSVCTTKKNTSMSANGAVQIIGKL